MPILKLAAVSIINNNHYRLVATIRVVAVNVGDDITLWSDFEFGRPTLACLIKHKAMAIIVSISFRPKSTLAHCLQS